MGKKLQKILIALVLASLLGGCAKNKPAEKANIEALKPDQSHQTNTIRLETIKQTARSIGAQAALAWQSYHLNAVLEKQKKNLDHIFNFNYLMLADNVLPPILVEGRNTLNLADDFTIRVSDHDYQIVQPPRFVTTPPNWRNYIWMIYNQPEKPNATLLPQNKNERNLWNEYIRVGWNDGIDQADQIFSSNLARLHRDYEGMILYRKLLAQNMVTEPYVSQAELGITGDGDNLHINDRVLRITSISQLKTDAKNWRAATVVKHRVRPTKPTLKDKI